MRSLLVALALVGFGLAPGAVAQEAAVARLFPDRAAHEAEEQERMEMLDAHWDVIVYGDE